MSEAAVAPERWSDMIGRAAEAVGAFGAALIPVEPGPLLASPGLEEAVDRYVREGWAEPGRDPRRRAIPALVRGAIVAEEDVLTPEEIRRSAIHRELLEPMGMKDWLGMGIRAGATIWCLSVQGRRGSDSFGVAEKAALGALSARFSEVATLSEALGRKAAADMTRALDHAPVAALAINAHGRVNAANLSAQRLFDQDFGIAPFGLRIADERASQAWTRLVERLRWTPRGAALEAPPIVVRRADRPAVTLRALPLDGAARSPFGGAAALVLIDEVAPRRAPAEAALREALGLTRAEARLASRLATGEALEQAAEALSVSKQTARTQLKSIFAKTGTHRQGQLVSLLGSFPKKYD